MKDYDVSEKDAPMNL